MMSFPSPEGRRAVRSRFGVLLRTYREGRSLTQGQLAKTTNYSMALISRLESGQRRPSREVVESLATALSLSDDETEQLLRTAGLSAEGSLDDITHLTDAILTADPRDMIIRALVQSDLSSLSNAWRDLTSASLKIREATPRASIPALRSLLVRRDLTLTIRIYAARKLAEAYRRIGEPVLAEKALDRGEWLIKRMRARDDVTRLSYALGDPDESEQWPVTFLKGSFYALRGEVKEQIGDFEVASQLFKESRTLYASLRSSLPTGQHLDAAQLGLVRSTIRLARVAVLLGENDSALAHCEQAREDARLLPASWQREEALRNLKEAEALARARKEDFEGAIRLHLAALADAEATGAVVAVLRNRVNLGDDYRRRVEARLDASRRDPRTGRLERSSREALSALLALRPDGTPRDREIGQWIDEAERHYAAAERWYRERGREPLLIYGQLLTGKAIILRFRGRFEEAESLLLQALAWEGEHGQNTRLASVHTALGDVAWDRKMLQDALRAYRLARTFLVADGKDRDSAKQKHILRLIESQHAVESALHINTHLEDRADLAGDWHRARNRLIRLVHDTVVMLHVRPRAEDDADPLWLKELADFELLPGGRILAQNSLSLSLCDEAPDDYFAESRQHQILRHERFCEAVRNAETNSIDIYRDLCTRHEVESRLREPSMRQRLLQAKELLHESGGTYQLEAADFQPLPVAFMVKGTRTLIEIPRAFATRLRLEGAAHLRGERPTRDYLCYRIDDATLADQLRDLFDILVGLSWNNAVGGAHGESTDEWLRRLLEQRVSPGAPTL